GGRAGELTPVASGLAERGLDELDVATGPEDAGRHGERSDRDRAQDLDGDPGDDQPGGLERAAEQRGRGPGVLGAGVPRAARQPRRDEDVAAALVERRHAAMG